MSSFVCDVPEEVARSRALEHGEKRYASGRACGIHPDGIRYTGSKQCVACVIGRARGKELSSAPAQHTEPVPPAAPAASLQEAVATGNPRYIGAPCLHGHGSIRRTFGERRCVVCKHIKKKRLRPDEQRRRSARKKLGITLLTPQKITDTKNHMLRASRRSAHRRGIPFSITVDDIVIPEYCPVFPGLKLSSFLEDGYQLSNRTLDRVDNSLGYIPGNVAVISRKANMLKSDASPEQLYRLYLYSKGELPKVPH